MQRLTEGRQISVANRLHHLDRDNLVVRSLHVPIVLETHLNALGKSRLCDPLERKSALLSRQRDRGDAAAVLARSVQAPAAPAGPDFEHMIGRLQLQGAAECFVLFPLRLFQRLIRRAVTRGRVH